MRGKIDFLSAAIEIAFHSLTFLVFWTILTFVSGCSFDYDQLRGYGYADGGTQPDTQPRADVEPDAVKADTKMEPDSGAEAPQTEVGPDAPPAVPCTLWPQSGCPTGQGCYHTTSTACGPKCANVGTSTQGGPCNGTSPCAAGFACDGGTNKCQQYCRTTADCPSSTICRMRISGCGTIYLCST